MLRKLWRIFRWWLKCLWAGKVVPRKEAKLFSRSYMRRVWMARLRGIDRDVNDWNRPHGPAVDLLKERAISFLLRERRIMVAKRRAYRFE